MDEIDRNQEKEKEREENRWGKHTIKYSFGYSSPKTRELFQERMSGDRSYQVG